jgi:hypothetical protein
LGDKLVEPNETFSIHITTSTAGAMITDGDATYTIVNDD